MYPKKDSVDSSCGNALRKKTSVGREVMKTVRHGTDTLLDWSFCDTNMQLAELDGGDNERLKCNTIRASMEFPPKHPCE